MKFWLVNLEFFPRVYMYIFAIKVWNFKKKKKMKQDTQRNKNIKRA